MRYHPSSAFFPKTLGENSQLEAIIILFENKTQFAFFYFICLPNEELTECSSSSVIEGLVESDMADGIKETLKDITDRFKVVYVKMEEKNGVRKRNKS